MLSDYGFTVVSSTVLFSLVLCATFDAAMSKYSVKYKNLRAEDRRTACIHFVRALGEFVGLIVLLDVSRTLYKGPANSLPSLANLNIMKTGMYIGLSVYLVELCYRLSISRVTVAHHLIALVGGALAIEGFIDDMKYDFVYFRTMIILQLFVTAEFPEHAAMVMYRTVSNPKLLKRTFWVITWQETLFKIAHTVILIAYYADNFSLFSKTARVFLPCMYSVWFPAQAYGPMILRAIYKKLAKQCDGVPETPVKQQPAEVNGAGKPAEANLKDIEITHIGVQADPPLRITINGIPPEFNSSIVDTARPSSVDSERSWTPSPGMEPYHNRRGSTPSPNSPSLEPLIFPGHGHARRGSSPQPDHLLLDSVRSTRSSITSGNGDSVDGSSSARDSGISAAAAPPRHHDRNDRKSITSVGNDSPPDNTVIFHDWSWFDPVNSRRSFNFNPVTNSASHPDLSNAAAPAGQSTPRLLRQLQHQDSQTNITPVGPAPLNVQAPLPVAAQVLSPRSQAALAEYYQQPQADSDFPLSPRSQYRRARTVSQCL